MRTPRSGQAAKKESRKKGVSSRKSETIQNMMTGLEKTSSAELPS